MVSATSLSAWRFNSELFMSGTDDRIVARLSAPAAFTPLRQNPSGFPLLQARKARMCRGHFIWQRAPMQSFAYGPSSRAVLRRGVIVRSTCGTY